jgi:carbon-monoxide dehydrogenase medium subunit
MVKPAAFDYVSASSVEHAVSVLAEVGDEAKLIAGGQSLIAMMNFRLARPATLVDINRVAGLDGIEVADQSVAIGALVRHRRLELGGDVPGPLGKLLSSAGHHVGHLPIRTRGTFCGSIAHADPASEWCVLAALLDAQMECTSPRGRRLVPAEEFFITIFTTALEADEVLTAVHLPLLGDQQHVGFEEFSRRAGDFAIVMAMSIIDVTDDVITGARIALGGVASLPVRATAAEATLVGQAPTAEAFAAAAEAAAAHVSPNGDVHGPAEFRVDLVRAMVRRSLTKSYASGSYASGSYAPGSV